MTFFLILLIVWIIEAILSATWNPYYFCYGVFVYKRTFPIPASAPDFPSAKEFSGKSKFVSLMPSMAVKALSEYELALRELFFQENFVSYVRILHGYLVYKPVKRQLVLRFSANLTTITFLLGGMGLLAPATLEAFQRDAVITSVIFPFIIGFSALIERAKSGSLAPAIGEKGKKIYERENENNWSFGWHELGKYSWLLSCD